MADIARGTHRLELPFDLTAAHIARAWLGNLVQSLQSEIRSDALLLASEVVTNAVRHGQGPVTVTVQMDEQLAVMVHDCGPGLPPTDCPRPAPDIAGGRGLLIVSMLSARWGVDVDPVPPGKTVWFQIDVPDLADRASSGARGISRRHR